LRSQNALPQIFNMPARQEKPNLYIHQLIHVFIGSRFSPLRPFYGTEWLDLWSSLGLDRDPAPHRRRESGSGEAASPFSPNTEVCKLECEQIRSR
jgi:hypothetical protein